MAWYTDRGWMYEKTDSDGFLKSEYWPMLLIRHNLDVMHIEKNIFENIFQTVMDTPKTKDNIKARKDVEQLCNSPSLHLLSGNNNKFFKPKASYSLTKNEVNEVCQWLKQVKFPDNYASNIGGYVNVKDGTFYNFKSHDCHVFMQRLLPIVLRGMLPTHIWESILELCSFFRVICSMVLHSEDLQKLKESIVVTICKLEKIFPPGFFDSMEHLAIHLTNEAILGGPVQFRWMYPYERKLGRLKRMIRNKGKIEGSIVQSNLVDELSNYCSLYLEATIREPRNFAPNISCSSSTDLRLSIFKHSSRRLYEKGGKDIVLLDKDKDKAHNYILLNCQEVLEFVWLFDKELRDSFPNYDEAVLDKMKDEKFAKWFEKHVMNDPNKEYLRGLAQGPLTYVKSHKGYFVNGYKFHTRTAYDGRVTQNSTDTARLQSDAHYDSLMPARRGCASQVQLPEPEDRHWIRIVDGEFSNQGDSTRIIGVILQGMWSGPWDSWRDVSSEDRARLFERFQGYFQWEEKWNVKIYTCWEKCIAGKFPNLLKSVRNKAKETARSQGLHVGEDLSVLIDFKPPWIRSDIWKQMIAHWNTPKWKAKSKRNSAIREKSISTGGKHTLGSQSYATARRNAAKKIGRQLSEREMWKQTHCRKGSRPLDKDISCSSSNVDSEGNAEEENLVWVDDRAEETLAKYDGLLIEKYGDDLSNHPQFDQELWSQATRMKNGKAYRSSKFSDPYLYGRKDPEAC